MLKALAIKELREVLGLAALGLGSQLVLVACVTTLVGDANRHAVPFVESSFLPWSSLLASLLAVGLGFRQAAVENRGTYLFLLHRPIRRDTIFLTKLAIGLAVFVVCIAVPILLYAFWAALPGTHASPFEWSMTGRSWQICFVMPLAYLAAFLCGIRPAHWFGTRVLPLAAVAILIATLMIMPWPWALGLPVLLAADVLLVANICYVARQRDYA